MKNLFPSLPDPVHLSGVFKAWPDGAKLLIPFIDHVMNAHCPLSAGERELMAAYVSSLNACAFCAGSHTFIARAHGIDIKVIDALLSDLSSAPIDAKMRPLFAYARKLTESPAKITEADAQAVYDAGWNEDALFATVQVTSLFNMMNRIVEGTGVAPYPIDPNTASKEQLAARRAKSYVDFGRELGVIAG